MRVFVYYNLIRKCFSIQNLKTRRVEHYADKLLLKDVQFRVQEGGRQRVLRERRKNVHAGAVGHLIEMNDVSLPDCFSNSVYISYNPYKYSTFVESETKMPIYTAKYAYLFDKKVLAVK